MVVSKKISNGMNCSNCHLDAGTKAWGNNYIIFSVSKMRGRRASGGL
jgi:thiosulfate dehydrogenase